MLMLLIWLLRVLEKGIHGCVGGSISNNCLAHDSEHVRVEVAVSPRARKARHLERSRQGSGPGEVSCSRQRLVDNGPALDAGSAPSQPGFGERQCSDVNGSEAAGPSSGTNYESGNRRMSRVSMNG